MNVKEIRKNAAGQMGYCFSCQVCDGVACKNSIPGPGCKGQGKVFNRNYLAWQNIFLNMDTISENKAIDTSFDFFGQTLTIPVCAAPIGAMKMHYGEKYDDLAYNELLIHGAKNAGIIAWTGDGTNEAVMESAVSQIAAGDGCGVPTIKPWDMETVFRKIKMVLQADTKAIAIDIDAAVLPFL